MGHRTPPGPGATRQGPTARLFSPGPLSLQRGPPCRRRTQQWLTLLWAGRFPFLEASSHCHRSGRAAPGGSSSLPPDPFGHRTGAAGHGQRNHRQHLEDQVQILGRSRRRRYARRWSRPISSSSPRTFREGWGAVLNEAMSSACARNFSHAAAPPHISCATEQTAACTKAETGRPHPADGLPSAPPGRAAPNGRRRL